MRTTGSRVFLGLGIAALLAPLWVAAMAQTGSGQPSPVPPHPAPPAPPARPPLPRAVREVAPDRRIGVALMSPGRSGGGNADGAANGAGGGGSGSGHLVYGGSGLMQNVKLFQVVWGAAGPGRTYQSDVTDGRLAKAYKAYVEGTSFNWISSEYTTALYHIGHGRFAGTVTLSLIRAESKRNQIGMGDVEAELSAQIDAHALPGDPDAMFMIDFPAEVNVSQGESSYGRGVGTVPVGCVAGQQEDAGLCYAPCRPGFSGVGPVCWGECPPDHHNDGATCRKDVKIIAKASYGRGVGTVPAATCGAKELDAGLCYDRCPAGFHGVGPVCWQVCPAGYHDDGATCRIDAHIIGSDNSSCPWYDKCGLVSARGCSRCPAGYHNDGCTCRRDVNIIAKQSKGRGVGTIPGRSCEGKEMDAGLCYDRCRDGYHGVGPVCWASCPAGYKDDGATCRIDADIVARPSYGRGVGTPRTNCGPDKEYDAGLCYDKCDPDYHGIGPVCWGHDSFCRGHDGFCGFHSSYLRGVQRVRYAVLADMAGSACAGRCWAADAFNSLTKTFTHEYTEAVTDPDLNLGWNDVFNGEIADICNSQFTSVALPDGSGTFAVQKEWSNASNSCRL